jgi:hypothetical protein
MYRHWQQLGKYDAPLLTMKPNKIIPTPMRNGCEGDEADIGNVCQSIGEENLVFSSDYPHSDSDFSKPPRSFFIKKCRRAIARRYCGLTASNFTGSTADSFRSKLKLKRCDYTFESLDS